VRSLRPTNKKTGLGRDRHPHLLRHFQSGTADEAFLVQELLDQALQVLAHGLGHPMVLGDVTLDDGQLVRRQRLRQRPGEAPARQPPGQQGGGRQQDADEGGFH
jgi:hypothetical protein